MVSIPGYLCNVIGQEQMSIQLNIDLGRKVKSSGQTSKQI